MPELPEVEVVRRGLQPHVAGRTIRAVEVHHDRAVRRHPGGANDFRAVLIGRRIEAVRRRGKYLWWALDDGDAVVAHLGMSGQFRVGTDRPGDVPLPPPPVVDDEPDLPPSAGRHPHLRIRFTLTDPADPEAPASTVDFLDQRTFGGMAFAPGGADLPDVLAHIARDPLDPAFDPDAAVAAIRAKRSEIKRVLLDQTVVSGIGNIYADEALWAAGLHYARPTATMTRAAAAGVLTAATEVMTAALAVGGTSFDALYVNVDGESGYFARSLHAYGRVGEPCDRCGTPMKRDAFMNRSSFFCPQCQRPPRAPRRTQR
ncbi:bifunctional DNA-formamidopyrimidine glycosylase/DNA-(apurinic or apyrimidinic site) lyase [Nakamurella flava]|uniref:Formamidopyrimidine-DNA glycosylase n=1 Tax=Nakamurella flava TaxID=2576308 RepID=A0A4U6QLE9_9ACTN|nr:bifunctional DNA-formamidopyrimidine glycosylase/DNA-(apurinic or apyrimidinic site) lyase [Nakamurella flava]TKV61171.1 bifunctional DNA-formamidopyrimidine glycosylase/DNA-(apurinic or apyrimidinic site) lyase [Nakamurella flava]